MATGAAHLAPAAVASEAHRGLGEVPIEVLLGRPVIEIDQRFTEYVAGASVLVTGAGGSVGNELCARLARLGASALTLVDHSEAALEDLVKVLRDDADFAAAVPILADIRNRPRTIEVFERCRPDIVFHTAAYKHVPLLEANPVEAVANNVLGTKSVVDAARRARARRLVMLSTDKAVEPASILGQTKAVAERIVAAAGCSEYTSIRLANVVDSAGSMLPVFRKQIARGGPLTITHPDMTRYLMTVGEAAGLAIAAGALADSRAIFWLDVRPPVRVLDLAHTLSDASPYEVDIEFVGLRAGERLHERLFHTEEEVLPTACDRLFRSPAPPVDRARLEASIGLLARHVERASAPDARDALAAVLGAAPVPRHRRPTTAATRRYFEKRAHAFDRLHDKSSVATRVLRSGPARGREFAVSMVARHPAADILDLGCGPGRVAEAIMDAGARAYTGIDLSPRMLTLARARLERFGSVELLEGDFLEMDVRRTFDVVLALGLFDYLGEPARAASWIRARCSSMLVASFARWEWLKGPIRHLHYELLHRCPIADHTEAEVEALLRGAGFSSVDFPLRGRRGFWAVAR